MRWLYFSPLALLTSACLPDPVLVGAGDTGDCGFMPTWYRDADLDGHGDPEDLVLRCLQPEGYVGEADDCDDQDALVWQGETAWPDVDGDGYGADGWEELVCGDAGAGLATQGGDCDDTLDTVHEDAPAVCGDDVDNNCDSQTDCSIPEGVYEPEDADAWMVGAAADELGASVAVVGDVNQDRVLDVLVGMPRFAAGEAVPGEALLLLGPLSGELALEDAISFVGTDALDEAGRVVSAAGDVDEDGVLDMAIGARKHGSSNVGAVFLVHGPVSAGGTLGEGGTTLLGEAENGLLGSAVLGGVDLLGEDGVAEIGLGSPGYGAGLGAVWLISGPLPEGSNLVSTVGTALWTSAAGGQLGSSLAHIGDADGDGLADLALGAPTQELDGAKLGGLWLIPAGAPSGDVADLAIGWAQGPKDGAQFTWSLSALGDADGDGRDDLLVGAPNWSGDPAAGGAALLLLSSALVGAAGGLVSVDILAEATLYGSNEDEQAGFAVLGTDDIDADGTVDFCVGAPGAERIGVGETGGLFCWYGPVEGPLPLLNANFSFRGAEAGERLGASAAVASDLNGLGVPDLLIGAPGEVTEFSTDGSAAVYLLLGDGY